MDERQYVQGAETTEKFSGKERDDKTGFDYFGARYYMPGIGRFLSTDRFADKYPSLTPYQYAANEPVRLIDVNGDSIDVSSLNEKQLETFTSMLSDYTGYSFSTSSTGMLTYQQREESSSEVFGNVIKPLLDDKEIFSIESNKSLKSPAGLPVPGLYNKKTNTLEVRDFSAKGTMTHELFHAFQDLGDVFSGTTADEQDAYLFQTVVGVQSGETGWQPFYSGFMLDYLDGSFNFSAYNSLLENFHSNYPYIEYRRLKKPTVKYNRENLPTIYNVLMGGN